MNKIRTLIDKEWAEVFKNRVVLFTVVFLPLLFAVMPLVILYSMQTAGANATNTQMPPEFSRTCGNLSGIACMQVFLLMQFMMFFMIIPLAVPVAISAYSIVGEKTTRSLEPLLATPISTVELLLGKGLAAAIPAIAGTWGAFAFFVVGARVLVAEPAVLARLLDPMWLVAVLILGPLMAIAAVNVSIIVSARVSDPRTAEQLSMVLIVPVLGVFFAQISGLVLVDAGFVLVAAALVLLADVGLVYLGASWFQRETILTRWK